MINYYSGFFVSFILHLGLIFSFSSYFSIDFLSYNKDLTSIPAYVIYENETISKIKPVKKALNLPLVEDKKKEIVDDNKRVDSILEKLNLNKKEETFKGFFIWKNDYMNPYKLALNWMSRKWFVDLINFDYLRQYNFKLLEEEGIYRGTTKHLKLFHYPYPIKLKMKFPEREKVDSLI